MHIYRPCHCRIYEKDTDLLVYTIQTMHKLYIITFIQIYVETAEKEGLLTLSSIRPNRHYCSFE